MDCFWPRSCINDIYAIKFDITIISRCYGIKYKCSTESIRWETIEIARTAIIAVAGFNVFSLEAPFWNLLSLGCHIPFLGREGYNIFLFSMPETHWLLVPNMVLCIHIPPQQLTDTNRVFKLGHQMPLSEENHEGLVTSMIPFIVSG